MTEARAYMEMGQKDKVGPALTEAQEIFKAVGDRFHEAYVHVENPHGETWFCDPAYWWFRDVFLEMAREAGCETVNCTEGGILFGPPLRVATIEAFVEGRAYG